MQVVSDQFKQAILAPERRLRSFVEITLFDNSVVSKIGRATASGTVVPPLYVSPEDPVGAKNVLDGAGQIGHPLAFTSLDESCIPSATLFPVPDDGGGGWWSNQVSGPTGAFAAPPSVTLDMREPQSFDRVIVTGDPDMGWAVNWDAQISMDNITWTYLGRHDGVTSWEDTLHLAGPRTGRYLRITVYQFSKPYRYGMLTEAGAAWVVSTNDSLANRIKAIDIKREAYFENEADLPIGNYSAADLTLELDNTDRIFYQHNKASPYAKYLRPNKRVRVEFGLHVPDSPFADADGYEWVPQGTFYTNNWRGALTSATVTVDGWDRMKVFDGIEFDTSIVYQNMTISNLITTLAHEAKLDPAHMDVQPTTDLVSLAWFDKQSFTKAWKALAAGETGYLRFDEFDRLSFRDRHWLASTRLRQDMPYPVTYLAVDYPGGFSVGDGLSIVTGGGAPFVATISSMLRTTDEWGQSYWRLYLQKAANSPGYPALPKGAYVTRALPVMDLSVDDAISDANDEYTFDRMKNKVTVKVQPYHWALDQAGAPLPSDMLYHNDDAYTLAPGGTHVFDIFFDKKPVLDDPTHHTAIHVNVSTPTGYAQPVTDDPVLLSDGVTPMIQASWVQNGNLGNIPYAWGGHLQIKNNDVVARTILTTAVSGFYLESTGGQEVYSTDDLLIALYGEKAAEFTSNFITNTTAVQGIADNMVNSWKNPSSLVKVSLPLRGLPHAQLGDRIRLYAPDEGYDDNSLTNHFYIVRISTKWADGGLDGDLDCLAC